MYVMLCYVGARACICTRERREGDEERGEEIKKKGTDSSVKLFWVHNVQREKNRVEFTCFPGSK